VADWRATLAAAGKDDFVYADPPYVGRHSGYYNSWSVEEAERLAEAVRRLPCGYAVSMWQENAYRRNAHLRSAWKGLPVRAFSHFYHVGPTEALRNPMTEALVVKPDFVAG
jgi:DNA adenine methylase